MESIKLLTVERSPDDEDDDEEEDIDDDPSPLLLPLLPLVLPLPSLLVMVVPLPSLLVMVVSSNVALCICMTGMALGYVSVPFSQMPRVAVV